MTRNYTRKYKSGGHIGNLARRCYNGICKIGERLFGRSAKVVPIHNSNDGAGTVRVPQNDAVGPNSDGKDNELTNNAANKAAAFKNVDIQTLNKKYKDHNVVKFLFYLFKSTFKSTEDAVINKSTEDAVIKTGTKTILKKLQYDLLMTLEGIENLKKEENLDKNIRLEINRLIRALEIHTFIPTDADKDMFNIGTIIENLKDIFIIARSTLNKKNLDVNNLKTIRDKKKELYNLMNSMPRFINSKIIREIIELTNGPLSAMDELVDSKGRGPLPHWFRSNPSRKYNNNSEDRRIIENYLTAHGHSMNEYNRTGTYSGGSRKNKKRRTYKQRR